MHFPGSRREQLTTKRRDFQANRRRDSAGIMMLFYQRMVPSIGGLVAPALK